MKSLQELEVWFVTGSQHLRRRNTEESGRTLKGNCSFIECRRSDTGNSRFKPTVKSPEEIYAVCADANAAKNCIGIIAWMHTFSPAKMWIGGLKILHKPLLHLHTQFNRDIPWSEIDMDFMNLNQSAHGDREFGFIMSRMRLKEKWWWGIGRIPW